MWVINQIISDKFCIIIFVLKLLVVFLRITVPAKLFSLNGITMQAKAFANSLFMVDVMEMRTDSIPKRNATLLAQLINSIIIDYM